MPLIEARNIGIEFPVAPPNAQSFRHLALRTASRVGGKVLKNEGSFRFVQALDDISFTLHHGDRLGLIGHNGAGKTTLIRVLAGIYEPTRDRCTRWDAMCRCSTSGLVWTKRLPVTRTSGSAA